MVHSLPWHGCLSLRVHVWMWVVALWVHHAALSATLLNWCMPGAAGEPATP